MDGQDVCQELSARVPRHTHEASSPPTPLLSQEQRVPCRGARLSEPDGPAPPHAGHSQRGKPGKDGDSHSVSLCTWGSCKGTGSAHEQGPVGVGVPVPTVTLPVPPPLRPGSRHHKHLRSHVYPALCPLPSAW